MAKPAPAQHVYDNFQVRLGGISLMIAGVLFVLYPAIRPFSDEKSLQGAAAFASPEWLMAHIFAMIAFTLLTIGFVSLLIALRSTRTATTAFVALVLGLIGIGLILPFYGGEAFGLHAIGQEALAQQNAHLMELAGVVRSGSGLMLFIIGMGLLAGATATAAVAVWKSRILPRWSGVVFALGFLLYIPQFFGTQPLRVVHGVLVAIGCIWLGLSLWRVKKTTDKIS